MGNTHVDDPYTTPVKYVKKIGPRRAEQLGRLKIFTVHDLLYHFPREYLDRSKLVSPFDRPGGETVTVAGRVLTGQDTRPRKNLTLTKVAVDSPQGVFYAVWFNQPHVKKLLKPGLRVLLSGKLERGFGAVQVQVQDFEIITGDGAALHAGRIVPVYPATAGVTQRMLRFFVHAALERWGNSYREFLPRRLVEGENLPELPEALWQIHFPENSTEAERARRRFIYEELFLFQLRLAMLRNNYVKMEKPHRYVIGRKLHEQYLAGLPFALTGAQERVVAEIMADMDSPHPMNRLLQGDVGSGKTVVAVLTLLRAVESGLQGAFMAPTEVLAEQHYLSLSRSLAPLGVRVAYLGGGMPGKERRALLEQVAAGEIPVVVGTQALLQEDVEFHKLAVVVIDEQHRFGVRQRGALQQKGACPDVLIMTATPIPRTLSMTVYGDLDISVIDALPPGRQPIRTYFVAPEELPRVYEFVAKQVAAGRQAYVVCPLVEESENLDLQAAKDLYRCLADEELRGCRVGLLHGRMKRNEKEQVMYDFRAGQIDVLVSTTVIEVGVDVPNATVMVIIDADRFGLAQLHQLRGRVGRGGGPSHCILAARLRSREAAERIKAMKASQDGFYLAERDLQIRGPGDMAGVKQSGVPEFRLADLLRDRDLLAAARSRAMAVIRSDPALTAEENLPLKFYLQREERSRRSYYHIS
ncbi:ATP-dependent DNA helicase RecG [Desulfoscipio geothermicus]|uniref:ATP-dependent DNA helicase RecG n=1 Tax=Desulfoscipio geothermicus DSM 3669 TaxID=1121426 RepID=A0A1I6DIX9_9FIRM|nr:ATP-dependent DNA helicase RecG [Desulfoscipio geothermicus]SFR05386.1 ATP-dependent DNA helicase RecG [Desulfoscipio geothermicus DSM 3669]